MTTNNDTNETTTGPSLTEIKQNYYQMPGENYSQHNGVCPRCGHCPHCGRGGYYGAPYYPYWPWYTTTAGALTIT